VRSEQDNRSGWRPIETAPRDRRVLLSEVSYKGERYANVGVWEEEGYCTKEGWRLAYPISDGPAYDHNCDGFDLDPTHWMPLPEPPT
jgi:hypothetical protein